MLVHFILFYKFLVNYNIFYRNGVIQTEMSVKKKSIHMTRLVHGPNPVSHFTWKWD